MRIIPRLVLIAVATSLFSAAALAANSDCRQIRGTETPEDETDDVFVCRQDNWIHQGGTRLGNLAGFDQDTLPSWNTTAPTTATGSGGGSFYATNSTFHQLVAPQDPRGSFVTEGTYTGVLDNIAVELYALVPTIFSNDLNLRLIVDGEALFAARVDGVRNTPAGDLRRFRYSFTNMYAALELLEKPNGVSTVHSIQLAANGVFIVDDSAVFVYDASDAAAGVVFNHETLSTYTQLDLVPPEE